MLASAATRSVVGRVGFGAASPHVVAAWTSAAPAASYHSKRQARKHAFLGQVRRRVNGQEATPTPAPSGELKYPLTHVPTTRLANGWTPPPDNPPDLPFRVQRTATGQFLPVYTDIKNARSRVVTVVRNIDGDIQEMQRELSIVCGAAVDQRAGRLEVAGRHTQNIRDWLVGLGF
mmetsp:Transcript_19854/g.41763  ORF Transcript_19854/g.41763 Transcript_19854/m.41763 type:complete len:175 (-) Transcript_19854:75-599(-)